MSIMCPHFLQRMGDAIAVATGCLSTLPHTRHLEKRPRNDTIASDVQSSLSTLTPFTTLVKRYARQITNGFHATILPDTVGIKASAASYFGRIYRMSIVRISRRPRHCAIAVNTSSTAAPSLTSSNSSRCSMPRAVEHRARSVDLRTIRPPEFPDRPRPPLECGTFATARR